MTIHLVDKTTKTTLCGYSLYPHTPWGIPLPSTDHWLGTEHKPISGPSVHVCADCLDHQTTNTRQSPHYRSMHTAPTTERILLKYSPQLYKSVIHTKDFQHSEWQNSTHPVWTEVRWVDKQSTTGSPAHWEPCTGEENTYTTEHIRPSDALGWLPLPPEDS